MEGRLAAAEEAHGERHRPQLQRRLVVPGVAVEELAAQQLTGDRGVSGLVRVPVGLEERRQPRHHERDHPGHGPPASRPCPGLLDVPDDHVRAGRLGPHLGGCLCALAKFLICGESEPPRWDFSSTAVSPLEQATP